jgi:hypothetical protein
LKLTRPTAGLEPRDREIPRSSGRKPRAGRQRGSTPATPRTSKTPGIGCGGLVAAKVAGGCLGTGRKAGVRVTVRGGNTRRRRKPRRGAESRRPNRRRKPPHPPGEQRPAAEGAAHGGQLPRNATHNGTRARRSAKAGRAPGGGETPEGRTLDVAAGRNKPARPVVAKTVVGVRNAEDGPKSGVGIPGVCGCRWLTSRRGRRTPWKALPARFGTVARPVRVGSGGRSEGAAL